MRNAWARRVQGRGWRLWERRLRSQGEVEMLGRELTKAEYFIFLIILRIQAVSEDEFRLQTVCAHKSRFRFARSSLLEYTFCLCGWPADGFAALVLRVALFREMPAHIRPHCGARRAPFTGRA